MWLYLFIINVNNLKAADHIPSRIYTLPDLLRQIASWRVTGETIAFTNGVFDILHPGHIYSLSAAAKEASRLVVGLNSDASVKRLKGESRPVNDEQSRATVLASLLMVDAVVLFETDTPLDLIKAVMPDVLVKGGDYSPEQVVGAGEVQAAGGRLVINPILEGFSTTNIIRKSGTIS